MNFDFNKLINRRGTNSMKWDEAEDNDVIPMWVADMDFETAPCIKKALHERVEHGCYGYTFVPESYYETVINWFNRRHQWQIKREWIQYTSGVVPAISCCIKALAKPGDNVLVLTPVYNCFFSSIRNNSCKILESPLKEDGDSFIIDFDDLEAKLSLPETTILLFCNPHNPAGRVWSREELLHVNNLCLKHNVIIISDEIHCELVMPGYKFIPFASTSDECQNNVITLNSPSKSFNTAGLQIANIISSNPEWQAKIDRAINDNEVCDVNPFGVIALQAAYNEGEEWLTELNSYIYENYQALLDFFKKEIPQIKVCRMEGTYLVWADVEPLLNTYPERFADVDELCDVFLKEAKVWVTSGAVYHDPTHSQHIRINIACPRSRMMEGLQRMKKIL